jgi:Predicted periplasmic protein
MAKSLVRYCPEPTSADTWLPPAESLRLGAGDCEDWCIFVRALLINGGIESSKLWLLIVQDLVTNQTHAVLWTPIRFCDGRAPAPLTHDKFVDYRPIAAFNDTEAVTFGKRRAG